MKKTIALTTVLGVASLSPALADTSTSGRFYAGVAGAYSSVDGTARAAGTVLAPGDTLTSLSINGQSFDDDDVAWSAFVGYQATPYIGLEAGFWDHGTFESTTVFGTALASLDVQEWYFGSTFRYTLPSFNRLALTGSVGALRTRFDADGSALAVVSRPGGPFPPPFADARLVPYGAPDDTTGGYWRAGVNLRITDSIEAGLNVGRRYLDVLQVESAALSVSYAF